MEFLWFGNQMILIIVVNVGVILINRASHYFGYVFGAFMPLFMRRT